MSVKQSINFQSFFFFFFPKMFPKDPFGLSNIIHPSAFLAAGYNIITYSDFPKMSEKLKYCINCDAFHPTCCVLHHL